MKNIFLIGLDRKFHLPSQRFSIGKTIVTQNTTRYHLMWAMMLINSCYLTDTLWFLLAWLLKDFFFVPSHHGGQYGQEERSGRRVAGALGEHGHQQAQQDGDGSRRDALQWHQTLSQPGGKSRFLWSNQHCECLNIYPKFIIESEGGGLTSLPWANAKPPPRSSRMFHGIFSWTISQLSKGTGASAEAPGRGKTVKTKINICLFFVIHSQLLVRRVTDTVIYFLEKPLILLSADKMLLCVHLHKDKENAVKVWKPSGSL